MSAPRTAGGGGRAATRDPTRDGGGGTSARRWRRTALLAGGFGLVAALQALPSSQAQPAGDAEPAKPAEPATPDKKPAEAPAPKSAEAPPPEDAAEAIEPLKFNHTQHAVLHQQPGSKITKPVVTDENCSSCHGTDAKGVLDQPAAKGHKPCLDSNCHIKSFLSVGPSTRGTGDPEKEKRYRKAAAFCLGCHAGDKGQAPRNFTKAKPDNTYRNNATPNYAMDMPHFDHTSKEKCRACHVVDRRSFKLALDAPGHAECATCHTETGDAQPMSECADCHKPIAEVTVPEWSARKRSDVRSCGSEGHRALAASRKKPVDKVPCFKHERESHRFDKDGKVIQCDTCHFIVDSKRRWGKLSYESVPDIKKNPIFPTEKILAHDSCGQSRVCHSRDTDDSRGRARCNLCHADKVTSDSLFR